MSVIASGDRSAATGGKVKRLLSVLADNCEAVEHKHCSLHPYCEYASRPKGQSLSQGRRAWNAADFDGGCDSFPYPALQVPDDESQP